MVEVAVLVGVGSLLPMVISLGEEGSWEVETHQQAKVDTPSLSSGLPLSLVTVELNSDKYTVATTIIYNKQ